jgi:signal transduction histidine kinase
VDAPGGVLVEFKKTEALERLHTMVDHSRVLARLGQMAAGVAHEIRNPLQAINFELGVLREARRLNSQEIEEHVMNATDEIQRLQRAVSGFLKVARLRQLRYVPLRMGELLEEVHDAMEAEANLSGLDLDLDIRGDLPETSGDRDVLRQAIENLLKNAIQALPSREGRIVIFAELVEGEIRVTVEDSGPGIRPEHLERWGSSTSRPRKGEQAWGLRSSIRPWSFTAVRRISNPSPVPAPR